MKCKKGFKKVGDKCKKTSVSTSRKSKKSNNPFKMWGSYIGLLIVILLSLHIVSTPVYNMCSSLDTIDCSKISSGENIKIAGTISQCDWSDDPQTCYYDRCININEGRDTCGIVIETSRAIGDAGVGFNTGIASIFVPSNCHDFIGGGAIIAGIIGYIMFIIEGFIMGFGLTLLWRKFKK